MNTQTKEALTALRNTTLKILIDGRYFILIVILFKLTV